MAAALVQTGTALNVGGGTSGTITLTGVTAGNLLVVYADDIDGLGATFSISDDQGNTWAQAVHNDNGGYTSSIHYCLNAAAGTTVITVTASTSTAFLAQAQEYSGGTWTLDTTSSIDETSTTSHVCSASAAVIDTAGEDVVVCNSTTADGGNFGTRTAGTGYTGLSSPTAQAFWQYQIFSTAQANEQGSFTSANSKATAACIAAFRVIADFVPYNWCGYKGLVQSGVELHVASGTTGDITFANDIDAGNLMVLFVDTLDNVSVTFTVSDDQGGDWAQAVSSTGIDSANKSAIWYCLSAIGGATTITVVTSGTCEYVAQAQEWNTEDGTWSLVATGSITETSNTGFHANSSVPLSSPNLDLVITNGNVDTTSKQTFGSLIPSLGYLQEPCATTSQVMWQSQEWGDADQSSIASEVGNFTSTNSRKNIGCMALFGATCDTGGGCWWPCCGGTGCTCCTVVWSDQFTDSAIFPGTYTLKPNTGESWALNSGNAGWNASTQASVAIYREIVRPALNGLCIKLTVRLNDLQVNAAALGVAFASGRCFVWQQYPSGSQALAYGSTDAEMLLTGSLTDIGPTIAFPETDLFNKVLVIKIEDVSSGGGTYDITYIYEGSAIHTESSVSLTIPDPFIAGMIGTKSVNTYSSTNAFRDFLVQANT